MKITRRKLRKLISEKIAHPRHDLGKNIADADFPIVVGYGDRSEIAYNQDELDDILDMITGGPGSSTNIPYSLDSLEDICKVIPLSGNIISLLIHCNAMLSI